MSTRQILENHSRNKCQVIWASKAVPTACFPLFFQTSSGPQVGTGAPPEMPPAPGSHPSSLCFISLLIPAWEQSSYKMQWTPGAQVKHCFLPVQCSMESTTDNQRQIINCCCSFWWLQTKRALHRLPGRSRARLVEQHQQAGHCLWAELWRGNGTTSQCYHSLRPLISKKNQFPCLQNGCLLKGSFKKPSPPPWNKPAGGQGAQSSVRRAERDGCRNGNGIQSRAGDRSALLLEGTSVNSSQQSDL